MFLSKNLIAACAWATAGLGFGILYAPVSLRLVRDWATDDNYSHGFLIIPFALYFAWDQRARLAAARVRPAVSGLWVVGAGLTLLLIGQLGAELFLARTSMIVVTVGALAYLRGWQTVRVLGFPFAFLLLMVPIPAIIFNKLAFPLQLLASRVGEWMLGLMQVPVLREGNLIVLARPTLEVAEACSGIRSLISLLTLGIIYGYLTDPRPLVRWIIAVSTIPIAVAANGTRVAGTGVAAHYLGDEAAQGFFHTFSGWLMFGVAFVLLFLLTNLVLRFARPRTGSGPTPSSVVV